MKLRFERWLLVGPHPDDVELGCGGTIAKYSNAVQATYLVLSPCLDEPRNKNILHELENATKILGLSSSDKIIKDLERRKFEKVRPKVREILIELKDTVKPDLVLCPYPQDLHQDHSVVAQEVFRIFRNCTIFGYEVISSEVGFNPNLYIELSRFHIKKKIKALKMYKSQRDKSYFKPTTIEARAKMRGSQAKLSYAEAFEALRIIVSG